MPTDTCIFCKIIRGDIPSYKVYEDEKTFAFLDTHPINPGHILVIPKTHIPNFYDIDIETYHVLMETVHRLSKRVQETFHPKRTGLMIAGWDVPHTHVHVVPMNDYHDITSKRVLEGDKATPSEDKMREIVEKIQL